MTAGAARPRPARAVDESSVTAFIDGQLRGTDLRGVGERVERLRAAHSEAVRILTAAGRSAKWIAGQIGCHERVVVRARARHRTRQATP